MRTAFIEQLTDLAKTDERIFLLVGDLGYSVVETFSELFPERFINVGVAEQNMAGIATGLAMEGYCVFIYSIGNFPTLRCIEQIRYDICYHNANVKIVAVGGGYAYGPLGTSHHATEEIGMMRTIPNICVCAPGDPMETKVLVTFATQHEGPVYIRIGKAGEKLVHNNLIQIRIGEILKIKEGEKTALCTTGAMLNYVMDYLTANTIDAAVYSFPFVKPLNKSLLKEILSRYDKLITIEEHQADGGFGSAILENVNDLIEECPSLHIPVIKRIAIQNKFISVAGSQEYLRKLAGIELNKVLFEE